MNHRSLRLALVMAVLISVSLTGTAFAQAASALRLGPGYSGAISPDGNWVSAVPVADPHTVNFIPRGVGEPKALAFPNLEIVTHGWLPDGKRFLINGN